MCGQIVRTQSIGGIVVLNVGESSIEWGACVVGSSLCKRAAEVEAALATRRERRTLLRGFGGDRPGDAATPVALSPIWIEMLFCSLKGFASSIRPGPRRSRARRVARWRSVAAQVPSSSMHWREVSSPPCRCSACSFPFRT